MHSNWIVFRRGRGSGTKRLFCFPYAGGGASAYRSWMDEASDLELCLIQYPGRESRIRETPFTRMSELVPALVNDIEPWLDRPFAFYGHSLGAKIAFETIRALRRRGSPCPADLFVGASEAPQVGPRPPLLHPLGEESFLSGIQDRYSGVPQQILEDPELRALLIPTLRADVELLETYTYTPEAPLSCDITVFGGASDDTVDLLALQTWKHETSGEFRFQLVPGAHFFLRAERRTLLDAMESRLMKNTVMLTEDH